MPRFTFFDQHQSAIYRREDCVGHLVGTMKIGPCIGFFLYNPETQSCLAMHMDAMTSLAAVKTEIRKFLPEHDDIEKCHAFLVGGWQSAVRDGDVKALELPKFLRASKVAKLDTQHLLTFNAAPGDLSPANFFHTVVLNLDTGALRAMKTKMHDFHPATSNSPAEQALYDDTMEYVLHSGAYELSGSVQKMLNGRGRDTLRPEVEEFYQAIEADNDGTPLIPVRDMLGLAARQTEALALQASKGNALEVLRLLYTNFSNPVTAVPGKLGNTPLHYACDALNKKPNDYCLKVIVLMMLLHGKRDLNTDAGNSALAKLKAPELKDFKTFAANLLAHLNRYKEDMIVINRIVITYKIIMAITVDDVLEYSSATTPATSAKKLEIEARLMDQVGMIMLAGKPAAAAREQVKERAKLTQQ